MRVVRLGFLFVSLFALGCVHAQPSDGIIKGLRPMKDPTVLALDASNQYLVIAMEKWGRLSAHVLDKGTLSHEVELEMPPLEKGYVRWGPCLYQSGETIYFYSGVGKMFDWPTYRIHVARCNIESDLAYENGRLKKIRFHDELPMDLFKESPWPDATADGFGLIDPYVLNDDKGPVIFYTMVSHGITDVRYHQEFILSERLTSPTQVMKPVNVQPVYEGWADALDGEPEINVDDGVAEAPSLMKVDDERYLLFFSSYPTDHMQRIAVVESPALFGEPWGRRRNVAAARPGVTYEEGGVGGQDLMEIDGTMHLVYQGQERVNGKKVFRLALRPVPDSVFE